MENTTIIHLDGSEDITFPKIDEMRRSGKVISVKFGPNKNFCTEVIKLFQESVRRAQKDSEGSMGFVVFEPKGLQS